MIVAALLHLSRLPIIGQITEILEKTHRLGKRLEVSSIILRRPPPPKKKIKSNRVIQHFRSLSRSCSSDCSGHFTEVYVLMGSFEIS